jgi:hypothetical protein
MSKHQHLKISEERRAKVMTSSPEDWEITEANISQYHKQCEEKGKQIGSPEALRLCDVCGRVYEREQWKRHRYFELKQRKGSRKLYRLADGRYQCPIEECPHPGNRNHLGLTMHLQKHTVDDFIKSHLKIHVSQSSF